MKNIVVAVDGPAGSGKSSVSKLVAMQMGLKYIDSGAIYRTVTYFFIGKYGQLSLDLDFKSGLCELDLRQEFLNDGSCQSFLNSKNISEEIRTENITRNIGVISDNIAIREYVTGLLRSWSQEDSIIMDGRDIGTVVFPNADIKIYLDASVEERAARRFNEYMEKGKNVDLNEIKKQIILRDNQDKSRPVGALKRAEDAIYIDTSSMIKEEVILNIKQIIKEMINAKK